MQVKAIREGFYGMPGSRKRAGTIFEMKNEDVYKSDKDGKPLYDAEGKLKLTTWIEPQEPLERLGVAVDISKKATKGGIGPAPISKPTETKA